MAQAEDDNELTTPGAPALTGPGAVRRRRGWPVVLAATGGVAVLALGGAWVTRERIADGLIAGQLDAFALPATYRIESIGPRRQVLRDVVVGDPAHPDLTIERVETEIVARFGAPAIGRVTLVRPRLYGGWRGGKASFGSLDKVLYAGGGKAPFRLPDLDLAIVDGRARMASEFGAIGIKLQGEGKLRGGFAGTLAAIAPRLALGGCRAERATLYGDVRVAGERPQFRGPLRLSGLACGPGGVALANAALQVDATFDRTLDGAEGRAALRTGRVAFAGNALQSATGTGRLTWRNQLLTARYDLAADALTTSHVTAGAVTAAGVLRRSGNRIELEGDLGGVAIRMGGALDATLAQAQRAGAATLAGPLLAQARAALLREGRGSRLAATYIVRRSGATTNLVVPQATLLGGSGATLLSVSRLQVTADNARAPRLAGNFATGGAGLPHIAGSIERQPGGSVLARLTMAEYRAGEARFGVPRLTLVQRPNGAIGFAGDMRLSGALPGGRTENLSMPLEGNWKQGTLSAWRGCTTVRFDELAFADLTLERRGLTLCPPRGRAILAVDARGARLAAGASTLDLAGRLGTTPIRIRSGALGFAMPGVLAARGLDVTLGPAATASRFRIASLDARVGRELAGRFAGSDVRLASVPLDILDAAGAWRFAGGKLTLTGGTFRIEDRDVADRFRPLVADNGALELANNIVTAAATLREPSSRREVVRTAIRHDLASARGHADLAVTDLTFDNQVQPDTLTALATGVIANASGRVRGSGRIDWDAQRVTSSGRFTTDALDFAAVFGPVKGAAGTIVFTDLLGMVSAPDQTLRIAAVNPGIEVTDGELTYQLEPGQVLRVKGAAWPFLSGTLTLLPVTMRLGVAETRRYTLLISGMEAARFVERMELANLSATGTFDGALPLVFDENGGKIEGGQLRARPPGGNVSYVGALTYKDLSPMANFAFDALRSLDYRDMTVGMDGPLAGEIVTRLQFAGIRQGAGAKRNIVTNRLANLPIVFNVNVRAPFFQLATAFKSMSDPAYVRDPRSLGLIDAQGRRVAAPAPTGIQPVESGKRP